MNIKNEIASELKKTKGFLAVQDKKNGIVKQFADALAKNENMKVTISKCEGLMQPDVLSWDKQPCDDDYNKDDAEWNRLHEKVLKW
jgi:hypothetical protein